MSEPSTGEHLLQLYVDERSLVEAVALYSAVGLGRGDGVILVATPEHGERIARRLEERGFDVADLQRFGQLTLVDAHRLLARFMVGGSPDPKLFKDAVGGLVNAARAGGRYPTLRAFGEMVNLIWREDIGATSRLESLWNEVIETHRISLFCAYCLDSVEAGTAFPPELQALHSHLVPVDAVS